MNPKKSISWLLKNEWVYFLLILSYLFWHQYFYNEQCFSPRQEIMISSQGVGIFIRSLDEVLQGHVFFKDYFWWYGPVLLYLMAPLYYFTGKNIGSVCLILDLYLPILSVLMSYVYIRLLVKSSFLRILFVVVCLLHMMSTTWPASRHFVAELALAVFIISLSQYEKTRLAFISGILAGIAILFSYEYGLPATLLIFFGYIFCLVYFKERAVAYERAKKFFQGLVVSLTPFVFYMVYHGVLFEYIRVMAEFVGAMAGGGNPAKVSFLPPLPEVSFAGPFVFIKTVLRAVYTDAFCFYLPLITYLIAFGAALSLYIKKRYEWAVKLFVLAAYGCTIYFRTLTGPGYSVLAQGLVPAVTLGFFFLEYSLKQARYHYGGYNHTTHYNRWHLVNFTGFACFLASSMVWFSVTIQERALFSFPVVGNVPGVAIDSKRVYYDKVGFKISQEAYDQYTRINKFIENNTNPSDYLLVYPWGPYTHFTGRVPPLRNPDAALGIFNPGTCDFGEDGCFRKFDKAIERLEEIKSRYVILNTSYMNLSMVQICDTGVRGDVAGQLSWRTKGSLCFASNDNPMHIYLLENYHVKKTFPAKKINKNSGVKPIEYAVILERNREKKPFNRTFASSPVFPGGTRKIRVRGVEASPTLRGKYFKINSRKVRIEYVLKKPVYASHLKMKLLLRTGLFKKYFTKTRVATGGVASGQSIQFDVNITDLGDLGTVKTRMVGAAVPLKQFIKKIDTVWIELNTPAPYFIPEELEVLDLTLLLDERIGQVADLH